MGTYADEDARERGNWTGKLDFVLSAVGYTVGMGNVWGFPYKAFTNGGASFLFPYLIILAICGIPLYFLEVALGQFSSEGPITVWKVAPLFMGIGYGMIIVSGAVCIYYNVLISYAMYYMLVAFINLDDSPPWESCDNWWNTRMCRSKMSVYGEYSVNDRMDALISCMSSESKLYSPQNSTSALDDDNFTNESLQHINSWAEQCLRDGLTMNDTQSSSSTEEFLMRYVLREGSTDIENLGSISPKLCVTLLLAWLLVFASLSKGIQSSGKVVHVTATFPFLLLLIIFINGLTLTGYVDGITFYLVPQWKKLVDIKVWSAAASQIFYSLGIGFGGILTLSSYNKFYNNCYRDAIIVTLINSATSIFAGFAIFSVLGHISHETKRPITEFASSNVDLAFIAYPLGLSLLPASSFWSFLFFLMLVTLGLDSQFGMMETVISAVTDLYPAVLRKHKTKFTLVCCVIGFLLGIPQSYQGGRHVLMLMHDYSASYNIMIIALAEVVCVIYIYGLNFFRDDIKMMIGFSPSYYWIATWTVLSPLTILFILVMTVVSRVDPEVSSEPETKPDWAVAIGIIMACLPILVMVVVGLIQAYRHGWPGMIKPTKSWGPALPENRVGRYVHRCRYPSAYDFIPTSRRTSESPETENNNVIAHVNKGFAASSV